MNRANADFVSAKVSADASAVSAAARPIVLITGAAGNLGRSVAAALLCRYRVVGLDQQAQMIALEDGSDSYPVIAVDLSADNSVALALHAFRDAHGSRIASVVHLAAYFDFTGEDNPLYQSVNVDGTRRLLRALQGFEVTQFLYPSTMLVHAPCRPGERIDETQPLAPAWAYPKSKAAAEAVLRAERGHIASVTLRLAGVYDTHSMVPTLAQQMARIYERDLQSHLYAGSMLVGQSALHREDMLDAILRAVDRRERLPTDTEILIGEADAVGYGVLQDTLGQLIHGSAGWPTLSLPKPLAATGAWVQGQLEPVVPDAIDGGELPFIRPFMVAMADDHYALDIRRARHLLGWEPRHRLADELPRLVAALKADPVAWYAANSVTPPGWVAEAGAAEAADEAEAGPVARAAAAPSVPAGDDNPDALRTCHEALRKAEHGAWRWAHFVNIGLGSWLLMQPLLIGVEEAGLRISEMSMGLLLMVAASLALSWRAVWARWLCAAVGTIVMALPLLWSTASAAAYLSDTLVGAIIFGLAVCSKPEAGSSAVATLTGPTVPPGWSYNPSGWGQRLPIILLAALGLYVSRYLAAYQLGHIPSLWDPFFVGSLTDPRNGTEEIVTSWVSTSLPVSDAALGGFTYLLEILTGLVGSRRRWRTTPWMVLLFGLMIVPLGLTTIFFIIIQPVVLGTWSTLALVGAAAVLVQIPYSLDELLATGQFLHRRVKSGRPWLRVLFLGDTDELAAPGDPAAVELEDAAASDEFERAPRAVLRDIIGGGISLPWNLAVAGMLGLALLFTRVTLGAEGSMAHAHHIIGCLVLTVVAIAAADVAKPVRVLNGVLGIGLMLVPLMFDGDKLTIAVTLVTGLALVLLSLRRGPIRERYGAWNRLLV
jgi:nucleoside-diphosphate-sugar epimerase